MLISDLPSDPPLAVRHASLLSAELWRLAERRRELMVAMHRLARRYDELPDGPPQCMDFATLVATVRRTSVGASTA
jgi:hypothetical protein